MKFCFVVFGAGLLAFVSAGCGKSTSSPEDSAKFALEAQPIALDAEQVTLNGGQVDCGVREDLWEAPQQVGSRTVAKITDKGRALNISDDIVVAEPGYRAPYAQVRGKFPVQVQEITSVKDGPNGSKLAQIKGGILIQHSCLTGPLPLMGVKGGRFNQDVAAVYQFRVEGENWTFERIVH